MAILPPKVFPWKCSLNDEINSLVPLPLLEDGDVDGMVNWLAETSRELVECGCKIVKLHWEKGSSNECDWDLELEDSNLKFRFLQKNHSTLASVVNASLDESKESNKRRRLEW